MTKAKSKATVMVADGHGGMAKVQDRRFEQGDWPFLFEVPSDQADLWFRYFHDECQRRGWGTHSISQMEARENSGSTTVTAGGAGAPSLGVVWERKRDRAMLVRARSAGAPSFPGALAQSLFDEISRRHAAGAMERLYRRSHLAYEGLAWRGELWLDDTLRLGPPSRQDEMCLLGPRIVVVDALVDCVGQSDCAFVFENKMRELSAFLTVVLGTSVQTPDQGRVWTWMNGAQDCDVRQLGYIEPTAPQEIPTRGSSRTVPLRKLSRPDFSLKGIDGSTNEILPPEDIRDLWAAFYGLSPDRRRQFLQAAAKWQEALLHWRDRSTLSFVLMVVACEVLSPPKSSIENTTFIKSSKRCSARP